MLVGLISTVAMEVPVPMKGERDVLGDLDSSWYPEKEKFGCQAEILSVFGKRRGEVWSALFQFSTIFEHSEQNISYFYG